MHINTVTADSLRQDGTAFKCTLPEDGEIWMTIPDNLQGHIVWKKSYRVGWTKTPRSKGGFFYNLKQLQPADAPMSVTAPMSAPAGHNNPPPSNGNGHGEDRNRFIFLCGLMNHWAAAGKLIPDADVIETAGRAALQGYDQIFSTKLEDTF